MTYTLDELNKMMDNNGGNLDLRGTGITSLPKGLVVGGSLNLIGTGITSLPEGLVVGGYLDLENCANITSLPKGLVVGEYLDLRGTGITSLPKGLVVGSSLDLRGTGITSLPEGLVVGGYLDLENCANITSLPDGLAVGGYLDLRGTGIPINDRNNYRKLVNGEVSTGRYIYCDNILTHIRTVKKAGNYTIYIGKIPGKNVVTDGTNYAHCKNLRDGIADLAFKSAKDRGADQYKSLGLETELTVPEAVTMYRVITGACRQGAQSFVDSLGDKLKEKYTIRECIDITKGQYNAERFSEFFGC